MALPHYRAVFVSDFHFGAANAKPKAATEFFQTFTCETLFLVGDIFDAYVGGKRALPPIETAFRAMLACCKEAKYTPGNHDSILRKLSGRHFGKLTVEDEFTHTASNGTKWLVTHGDNFDKSCKDDNKVAIFGAWFYEYLCRATNATNRLRSLVGLKPSDLPKRLKAKSHKFKDSSLESSLFEYAAGKGYDGVIFGHLHQPGIRNSGPLLYVNTGDWVENQYAVAESADGSIGVIFPAET